MDFRKIFPPPAVSWALYDFANTIFSAIVVTVYLPLHFTQLSGKNGPLGVAAACSMIISGLVIPALGALTDRTGKTKFYLILSTLACVFSTACLSFTEVPVRLLAAFMLANFLYHSSLVFYNSLLPAVAPPGRQGFISGLGTGLGYLGVVLALPFAHVIDISLGRRWVFLLAAVLFLLFSLPLFASVPERTVAGGPRLGLRESLASVAREKPALYFLLGNFFVLDALNAVILWLSVFLTRTFGISQGDLIRVMLALNAAAFVFGLLLGRATDRFGSKKTLLLSSACLGAVLITVSVSRIFPVTCAAILVLGGASAAGIWTAGRKMLVELSPPERIGEFFGLYGFTTKVSAVGNAAVGLLADLFGFRWAVASLLFFVAAGLFFLRRVRPAGGAAPQ